MDFNSPEYLAMMAQYAGNFQNPGAGTPIPAIPQEVYQQGYDQPEYDGGREEYGGFRGGRGGGRGGAGANRGGPPPPKAPDTIYVSGINPRATKNEIAEHFGRIGIIKLDKKTQEKKINLYTNKDTGELKGDGTITYDDPATATAAIDWFNNQEWNGSVLKVSLAEQKEYIPPVGGRGRGGYGRPRGGDRGGYGGGGGFGGEGRGGFGGGGRGGPASGPDDWLCLGCGNNNFARRMECNKCHTPKPSSLGGGGDVGGYGGSSRGGFNSRGGYGDRGGAPSDRGYNDRGGNNDRRPPSGGYGNDRGGGDRGGNDRDRGYNDRDGGDRDRDRGYNNDRDRGYNDRGNSRGGGDRRDDQSRGGHSDYNADRRGGGGDDRRDRRDRPY